MSLSLVHVNAREWKLDEIPEARCHIVRLLMIPHGVRAV